MPGWVAVSATVSAVSLVALAMQAGPPTAVGAQRVASDPIVALLGVSATSTTDVWAVGTSDNHTATTKTAVRHWDGQRWTSYRSPSPCGHVNQLEAVDAVSATDVWAVGACASVTRYATLAEHYDGVRWVRVKTPNLGRENQLSAVDALSATDVWAAG